MSLSMQNSRSYREGVRNHNDYRAFSYFEYFKGDRTSHAISMVSLSDLKKPDHTRPKKTKKHSEFIGVFFLF